MTGSTCEAAERSSRTGNHSSPISTTTPRASATHRLRQRCQYLIRLRSTDLPADSSQNTRTSDQAALQNIHYTYDPVGNITHIHDDAQQTIYFRNRRVEPSAEYTYDAIYRLIEATGREHWARSAARRSPTR